MDMLNNFNFTEKDSSKYRILFVNPADLEFQDSESGRSVSYTPNLSLSFLYHWLKKQFGNKLQMLVLEQAAYGIGFEEFGKLIQEFSPHMVALSSKTFNILGAYKIAEIAKKTAPSCVIALGGAHATALPEYTLHECPHIDICVLGEGELTLGEIVYHLVEGGSTRDMGHISGVTYRSSDGRIIKTKPRLLIEKLDEISYPTYEEYDLRHFNYKYSPITHEEQIYFPIFASRGCVHKCTFCMPVLSRRFRYRSPALVMEEIRFLRRKFGVEVLYFEDSCMSTNKNWFKEMCAAFMASGLSDEVKWGFETRVDCVDEELLRTAQKAGCIYINYGMESGSDLILKKNHKGFSKKSILRAVDLTRKCGISIIHGSFILGLPYETRETIEETLDFIGLVDLNMIPVNVVDIYPGTELFEMVDRSEGGISWLPGRRMNWRQYGRNSCQTEVNDLSEDSLMSYYRKALDIVEHKTGRKYTI